MSDITHLTGSMDRLRNHGKKTANLTNRQIKRERRFAIDYFMLVAYNLLGTAILSQIFLIAWLDII